MKIFDDKLSHLIQYPVFFIIIFVYWMKLKNATSKISYNK